MLGTNSEQITSLLSRYHSSYQGPGGPSNPLEGFGARGPGLSTVSQLEDNGNDSCSKGPIWIVKRSVSQATRGAQCPPPASLRLSSTQTTNQDTQSNKTTLNSLQRGLCSITERGVFYSYKGGSLFRQSSPLPLTISLYWSLSCPATSDLPRTRKLKKAKTISLLK